MTAFGDRYRDRRVLVTGHTGFKGSWLALWLHELGAKVSGLALAPDTEPSHWDLLALDVPEHRVDVRDSDAVNRAFESTQPDIVFHLAAQPLVRRSYRDPLETWSTNVMGTANVLEACRRHASVRAVVAITTDKVYANKEWVYGYRETDQLGGHDPYSASKAACEVLIDSYRSSFFSAPSAPLLASARAGNVIGGGDWAEDRLIPDIVRATIKKERLEIRSPRATRPWQHVLESAAAYLLLGKALLDGRREAACAWNFGPDADGNRTVGDVLAILARYWPELAWDVTNVAQPHEATLLYLDNAKATSKLEWRPVWTIDTTLRATAEWYAQYHRKGTVASREQLREYSERARERGAAWMA